MKIRHRDATAIAAVLGLSLALAGCANGAAPAGSAAPPSPAPGAPAPPPAAQAAPVAAAPATPPAASAEPPAPPGPPASPELPEGEEHRQAAHGGIGMLIAMSLADVDLTADQHTAVEKVKVDLATKLEPAKAAGKDLLNLLADGVAAGSIDRAKADASIARLVGLVQTQQDAALDALNRLHAILTPAQRASLVDSLQGHFNKWKEAQGHDEEDDGHHRSGHLLALVKDLGISQDQAKQIKTSFRALMKKSPQEPEPAQARDHVHALVTSFKNDTFDARKLKTTPSAGASMVRWGATRRERFLEAAVPVLTPDQRAHLAQMLHARGA